MCIPYGAVLYYDNGDNLQLVGFNGGTAYLRANIGYERYYWEEQASYCQDEGMDTGYADGQARVVHINSISPARGPVGTTVPVTIFGGWFDPNATPTIHVSGSGVTVSNTNLISTGVISANFNIASDAASGNHSVTLTSHGTTSNGVKFFVQMPSKLERFDYPGVPNGYGPLTLTSNTNNEVRDVNGNILPGFTNQCGVYRNLVYELEDQEGESITQPFDITETFSNYSGVASLPANRQGHSSTGLLQDTMYFGKTLPDCPGLNDNESFDQRFFVTIGVTQYNLSTVVHISRGRSSGNWFVDVTTTTP